MVDKIKQQLKEQLKTEDNILKKEVINYILGYYDTDEDIKMFISDLLNHGCISGMVNNLIYYKDTNNFFDVFEDEIEDLITENMDMLGVKTRPLFIESLNGSAENLEQEKNLLSWFAFEETARNLNEELEINKDFI